MSETGIVSSNDGHVWSESLPWFGIRDRSKNSDGILAMQRRADVHIIRGERAAVTYGSHTSDDDKLHICTDQPAEYLKRLGR